MANQQNQTRLPAELKKASPADQVGWLLARSKAAGVGFEIAWRSAWKHIMWPHDTGHRREWRAVLTSERSLWETAYTGGVIGPASARTRAMTMIVWSSDISQAISDREIDQAA